MADESETKQKPGLQILAYPEACERCGRTPGMLYLWNGRWLCKTCLEEEQRSWGVVSGGPSAGANKIAYQRKQGLLGSLFDDILERTGLKKREAEVRPVAESAGIFGVKKIAGKYSEIVAFEYGKPLAEEIEGNMAKSPTTEGIIKKRRKNRKK